MSSIDHYLKSYGEYVDEGVLERLHATRLSSIARRAAAVKLPKQFGNLQPGRLTDFNAPVGIWNKIALLWNNIPDQCDNILLQRLRDLYNWDFAGPRSYFDMQEWVNSASFEKISHGSTWKADNKIFSQVVHQCRLMVRGWLRQYQSVAENTDLLTASGKLRIKTRGEVTDYVTAEIGDKSSGLPFMSKKAKTIDADWHIAEDQVAGRCSFIPSVAGKRTGFNRKMRVMNVESLSRIVKELRFTLPIQEMVKDPVNRGNIDWMYGLSPSELNAALSRFTRHPRPVVHTMSDWSKFDQTFPTRVADEVFNILGTLFDLQETETRLWWNCVRNEFFNSSAVIPGRKVIRYRPGHIPSGSALTSIVGSLGNWIIIRYILRKMNVKVLELAVFNDDSIVSTYGGYDISKFASIAKKDLGMSLSVEKTEVRSGTVHFLGHDHGYSCSWRPIEESLDRAVTWENHPNLKVMFPSKSLTNSKRLELYRIAKLSALTLDNPKMLPILYLYFRDYYDKIEEDFANMLESSKVLLFKNKFLYGKHEMVTLLGMFKYMGSNEHFRRMRDSSGSFGTYTVVPHLKMFI